MSVNSKNHQTFKDFVCGFGAASTNLLITFPINKIIFRQQLLAISSQSAFKQLQSEGILFLYRGLLPPIIQKSTSAAIMFGVFGDCNRKFEKMYPHVSPNIINTISAMIAGSLEAFLVPFERVQTLLQNKVYHDKFKNSFHAFKELKVYGFREYYRGLTPVLMRNGPSNVIFFLFRNKIKAQLPKTEKKSIETLENFISGGALGAIISTTFYPINSIKTHMMSTLGGRFPSFMESFKIVYEKRDRKFRNLFIGVHINYTRSLLSWGIINASYEMFKTLI